MQFDKRRVVPGVEPNAVEITRESRPRPCLVERNSLFVDKAASRSGVCPQ